MNSRDSGRRSSNSSEVVVAVVIGMLVDFFYWKQTAVLNEDFVYKGNQCDFYIPLSCSFHQTPYV